MSSPQLKDIWKIKGIANEPSSYEHSFVELSDDDHEPAKQTATSHGDSSGNEDDDEDGSCSSDSSEVCGTIASNKFAALDVSD